MAEHFISRADAESDLFSAAVYIGESIRSSDGHAEAMKAIVPTFLDRGDVDMAAELANTVDDPFTRDRLLIRIAEKCADVDDVDYALQLTEAIEDHGMQAEALERIASTRAGMGDVATAAEIAGSMVHPDYVYGSIAVYEAANGNAAGCDAALAKSEFASARVAALQHIASARISNDQRESAVAFIESATKAADDIEHDEERIRALCEIGGLFVQARRNDKAVETYDHAQRLADALTNMHRDYFLVTCALGFLGAGSEELCDRTLDLVRDKTQMASALHALAKHEFDQGDNDGALETLEEAWAIVRSQRDIETRDSRARDNIMGLIASEFAVFGQPERAIEVATQNDDPQTGVAALTRIAQTLLIAGDEGKIQQVIDAIPDDSDRMLALISLSDIRENSGDREAAARLLNEAASMADAIPQLALRASALDAMAERFAAQGDAARSHELALEALEVIGQIRDESSQAVALAALSGTYSRHAFDFGDREKQLVELMLQRADQP